MKIAISLLGCNDMRLLVPCIQSLLKSDLMNYNFKIFYIDNASTDGTYEYVQSIDCEKWIKRNTTNQGICIPRIEIMNRILEDSEITYTLEIHADMLFPSKWLAPLLAEFDDNTAIVMPFILNSPECEISLEQLEVLVRKHYSHDKFELVRQVHPWLLNNSIIRKIGYYDAIFSPQNCEDDDLMFNIIKNQYKLKTTKESIVCHYGGKTRSHLPSNIMESLAKFENKNGMTVDDFAKKFTIHGCIHYNYNDCKEINPLEFRFLSLNDRYDVKHQAWSRIYEYPYVLDTLVRLGANKTSTIHNTCWGYTDIHIGFKNDIDELYPLSLHSDQLQSNLPKTMVYDITKPIDIEYHNKFDFVLNISTVEEVSESNTLVLRNLLQQVKPGGYLIVTFDYKEGYTNSIKLKEVESFIGKSITAKPDNAINNFNSVKPELWHPGLECGVLVINRL
jgi:glycosyltransferase involved in cell wall biosynthesis